MELGFNVIVENSGCENDCWRSGNDQIHLDIVFINFGSKHHFAGLLHLSNEKISGLNSKWVCVSFSCCCCLTIAHSYNMNGSRCLTLSCPAGLSSSMFLELPWAVVTSFLSSIVSPTLSFLKCCFLSWFCHLLVIFTPASAIPHCPDLCPTALLCKLFCVPFVVPQPRGN